MLHTIGISPTQMAFQADIIIGIIPWPGHSKIVSAKFQALLAADTKVGINKAGVEPIFFIDFECIDGTFKKTRRVNTLKARSRLVIAVHVIFIQYNQGKGRSVSTFAVHIGACHLADTAT